MSSSVPIRGQYQIIGLTPANTNEATMFTAGSEFPVLTNIHVANVTASIADATIKWNDGSTSYSLIDTFGVPGRGYLVEDLFIPLRSSYTIKVTSGTANALTFTLVVVSSQSPFGQV